MTVLVSAASRHGSTEEMAERIAGVLRARGLAVDVRPARCVTLVDGYDAIVLGSAVYAGHWLDPARRVALRHPLAMTMRPVWLFSSGPVGDPPKPAGDPVDIPLLMARTHARAHRVFAGRIDEAKLGLAEKVIVRALGTAVGDFRDWAAIDTWAGEIADALLLDPIPVVEEAGERPVRAGLRPL